MKTVAQKGHIRPGSRIAIIKRVPGVVESLGLPSVTFVRSGEAELVFLFARARADLVREMPRAVGRLGPSSALWVFFRKGSSEVGLDMNRNTVWSLAEKLRMRPLGILSVDEAWSAFRLRLARGRAPASPTFRRRGRRTTA